MKSPTATLYPPQIYIKNFPTITEIDGKFFINASIEIF